MIECHSKIFDACSRTSQFHLYFISDVHGGSRNILEDKLDQTIKQILEDPDAWWVGLGDLGDYISFTDRRFEYYEMADWLDIGDPWVSTLDWLEDKLKPIAPRCLGLVPGNHEYQAKIQSHFQVHKHLCARLGVLDLGEACFFRLLFNRGSNHRTGKLPMTMYLTHGWGGGRTGSSRVAKLEQLMRDNDANIYAMGHVHGQIPVVKSAVRRVSGRGRVDVCLRYGLISGSYLVDSEYEKRYGYAASVTGSPCVTIWPYHNQMEVTL